MDLTESMGVPIIGLPPGPPQPACVLICHRRLPVNLRSDRAVRGAERPRSLPTMAAGSLTDRKRRSDAERNLHEIIEAGRRCFGRDPAASMTQIAREAGVGRVTLYGYFSSREKLLAEVLSRALDDVRLALEAAAPEQGDPMSALERLVERCWEVLDTWMGVRTAALYTLGERSLRAHHGDVLARVEQLLVRGRESGVFRSDLPVGWLVATSYAVMHAAQEEVDAGRLSRAAASATVTATLRSMLAR
jgi:AcrR family transcriptional regulator